MKTVEDVNRLKRNSDGIKRLFGEKIPRWKNDPKQYDKINWGFNVDDRFSACKGFEITFDSKMGVYGDSGCSTQLTLDKDIFKDHLLRYLNSRKEEIMLWVAKSIDEEAASLKLQAEEELIFQLEKIREL